MEAPTLTQEELERLILAAEKVKRGEATEVKVCRTRTGGVRVLVTTEE